MKVAEGQRAQTRAANVINQSMHLIMNVTDKSSFEKTASEHYITQLLDYVILRMNSDTKVRLEALHLMQTVTIRGKASSISHSALSFCGSITHFIRPLISSSKARRSSSWSVPQVQLPD